MPARSVLASAAFLVASSQNVFAQTTHEVTALVRTAYQPATLENVAVGDSIRVKFSTVTPHDIVSGSWGSPCEYDTKGGLNSGIYMDGEVFVFTVNSTDPQVFFCAVGDHCQEGMALVVNPSGDHTLKAYTSAAEDSETVGPTSKGPDGGVLETESSGGSSSATEAMTSMMTSAPSESSSMMTATEMKTSSETSMPSPTEMGTLSSTSSMAPAETSGGGASGLQSKFAMGAAVVAGAVAFAL